MIKKIHQEKKSNLALQRWQKHSKFLPLKNLGKPFLTEWPRYRSTRLVLAPIVSFVSKRVREIDHQSHPEYWNQ